MKKGINLIMPMAGSGSRFIKDGYEVPKPLIELDGRPFLYWATQSIVKYMDVISLTFVVLQQHIDLFGIDESIKRYYPDSKIVVLPKVLDGAVLTCKAGVSQLDNDMPIIFNDCDHAFICSKFYEFCKAGNFDDIDGSLLTFTSNDPKFSFVELDENNRVIRTAEKEAISDEAICGAYYFKNKDIFNEGTDTYLDNCNYSEYFVSGVYNEMIKTGKHVTTFNVDMHVAFGTPDEYLEAQKEKLYLELR